MNNLTNSEYQEIDLHIPREGDISDMVNFFLDQLEELNWRLLCTDEEFDLFREWHTSESLREKISDPSRFFRIIRDNFGEIIAYFESKQHSDYSDIQVVQWILVDQMHRNTGLSKKLRTEFYVWCREHGYMSTWTYVHQNNTESLSAHINLGELSTRVSEKILFVLALK